MVRAWVVLLALVQACSCEDVTTGLSDSGPRDVTPPDARASDAGVSDAGVSDAGASDAGPANACGCARTWTPLDEFPILANPSNGTIANLIWDGARSRLLSFGGASNRVHALSRGDPEPRRWRALRTTGEPPLPYPGAALAIDTRRDRLIAHSCAGDGVACSTRALDFASSSWSDLPPLPKPPRRYLSSAITYDGARDRLIVTNNGRVWALSLDQRGAGWTQLRVEGPLIGASGDTRWDAPSDSIIVMTSTSGLWSAPLADPIRWSRFAGNAARFSTSELDSAHRRIIAHTYTGTIGVWSLALDRDGAGWELIDRSPRELGLSWQIAVDEARNELVVSAPWTGDSIRNDVWAFHLDEPRSWFELAPSAESPVGTIWDGIGHPIAYDARNDVLLDVAQMFHGGDPPPHPEVWWRALQHDAPWNRLPALSPEPVARSRHAVVWDELGDRFIVFGGQGVTFDHPVLRDTWSLVLSPQPIWTELARNPGAVEYGDVSQAVVDPLRRRMIVFAEDAPRVLWSLSLADPPSWSELTVTGTVPSERDLMRAAYDPEGDRVIMYGGTVGRGLRLRDLWALELDEDPPRWVELHPGGPQPPDFIGHNLAWDPAAREMILLGFLAGEGECTLGDDIWALQLARDRELAWRRDVASGERPSVYNQTLVTTPDGIVLSSYGTWRLEPRDGCR